VASKPIDISFLKGQGVDDLLVVFDKLDVKEQKKIARKMTRAGAKVMLNTIKSLTPIDFDGERGGKHLVDTLKVRALPRSRASVGAYIRTGTRAELGIADDAKGYYPTHIEYGFTRKSRGGLTSTNVPAQSYLRAGFDIKNPASFKVMGVMLFKELKKRWLAK